MKQYLILLFILIVSNGVVTSIDGETINEDQLRLQYEDRILQGEDLILRIQLNLNVSELYIDLAFENGESEEIYDIDSFQYQSRKFVIGSWIELDIEYKEDYEEPGTYKGQIVAIPVERVNVTSIPGIINFEFIVAPILDFKQTVVVVSILFVILILPIIIQKDKKRIERNRWNIFTSFSEYLKYRFFISRAEVKDRNNLFSGGKSKKPKMKKGFFGRIKDRLSREEPKENDN